MGANPAAGAVFRRCDNEHKYLPLLLRTVSVRQRTEPRAGPGLSLC